jgi:hypothetical protein
MENEFEEPIVVDSGTAADEQGVFATPARTCDRHDREVRRHT